MPETENSCHICLEDVKFPMSNGCCSFKFCKDCYTKLSSEQKSICSVCKAPTVHKNVLDWSIENAELTMRALVNEKTAQEEATQSANREKEALEELNEVLAEKRTLLERMNDLLDENKFLLYLSKKKEESLKKMKQAFEKSLRARHGRI